jgi:hypothetical protein
MSDTTTKKEPTRFVCSQCRWRGPVSAALAGLNPHNAEEILFACPRCRDLSLRVCCDEPDCTSEVTCGTPLPDGSYRRTCGEHQPDDTGGGLT